jgi:hypothetical protein
MNVRDYYNNFKQTDFVDAIVETPLQYGYINSLNLFNTKGTNQTAVVFDKDTSTTTLLPQVVRGSKASTTGKEHKVESFALRTAYFKHVDRLTVEDIQGWRKTGTDESETLANATAEKMTDMRRALDQTEEYMKLQALKGVFKTPDGTVMADMFAEFGISQTSVDLLLGTSTTDIDKKFREIKSLVSKNVLNGGAIGGLEFVVDPLIFDKLISHPNMKTAYQFYLNSGQQALRDDLSKYMAYGIQDVFTHRGVRIVSYDATFNLPTGTTEKAFADNTGIAFASGVRDLFRGYYAPSNKLSAANTNGQQVYMNTKVDEDDEFVEFTLETAPLFFATKPASLIALTSSN